MAAESIIQQILASRRDLTREEIIEMIEGKVKSAKGFFTYEIAAQIVASELGVQPPQSNLPSKILIKNLVAGLNDVTTIGRVIHVSPSQAFARSDGTEGTVKRLLIADKSGAIPVVLWNDKAKSAEAESVKPGQIVEFSHCYVREGPDGKMELNLGAHGEIKVSPKNGLKDEYPPVESFTKKIGEITEKDRRVNVSGVVQRLFPESLFKRKDGSEGKTRRLRLRDSTSQIEVVFWNNKVEETEKLKEGNYLQIISARVKSRLGQLELHVEEASNVEVESETPSDSMYPQTRFVKVKEIKDGMRRVDVLAKVTYVGELREFERSGEARYFSQLLIADETGSIQLNLWEGKALLSKRISLGDVVLIEGAYVRKRFGEPSMNLDDKGSLTINPSIIEAETLPQYVEKIVKVADITEEGYVTVQGTVVTKPNVREVTTARNEKVKLASFEFSDGTGKAEVSLWRKLAETAEEISAGDHVKIINIFVKRDLSGQLKLSSSIPTLIERSSK